MKCFYHEEKDAVGQCQQCGKGLCKACLIEHNGICEDCYFRDKADAIDDEHNNIYVELSEYKKSIIHSLIMGAIGAVIMLILIIATGMSIGENLIGIIIFMFLPFGYTTLTKVLGKDPNARENNTMALFMMGSANENVKAYGIGFIIGKLIKVVLKLIIAFFVGIPCFAYLIYKLVNTNKQLVALESSYNATVEDFKNEMKSSNKR